MDLKQYKYFSRYSISSFIIFSLISELPTPRNTIMETEEGSRREEDPRATQGPLGRIFTSIPTPEGHTSGTKGMDTGEVEVQATTSPANHRYHCSLNPSSTTRGTTGTVSHIYLISSSSSSSNPWDHHLNKDTKDIFKTECTKHTRQQEDILNILIRIPTKTDHTGEEITNRVTMEEDQRTHSNQWLLLYHSNSSSNRVMGECNMDRDTKTRDLKAVGELHLGNNLLHRSHSLNLPSITIILRLQSNNTLCRRVASNILHIRINT